MAHTFLALIVSSMPQATKDNVPAFWGGLFSNDGVKDDDGKWIKEPTYLLLDAYNDKRELVHSNTTLLSYVQWEDNPQQTLDNLIASSTEYTHEEIKAEKVNVNSIWYEEAVL